MDINSPCSKKNGYKFTLSNKNGYKFTLFKNDKKNGYKFQVPFGSISQVPFGTMFQVPFGTMSTKKITVLYMNLTVLNIFYAPK